MTFAELRSRLLEALNVRTTPQFWTQAELDRYLNLGHREFARQSEFCTRLAPATQIQGGQYLLPDDLLKLLGVYFNGKLLEQRSPDMLDSWAGGTGHHLGLRGDGKSFGSRWRESTGESVDAWYLEDGKINLYPIPSALASVSAVRQKFSGTLAAGSTTITLPSAITQNENITDLFLDGVYQNTDAFTIPNSTTIQTDAALGIDVSYEVVAWLAGTGATASTRSYKYRIQGATGQVLVHIPMAYYVGTSAISLRIDGVTQAPGTFTEIDPNTISLTTALVLPSVLEVTIVFPLTSYNTDLRYVFAPPEMSDVGESPLIPAQFHDAIWQFAAFRALSREGRGKDIEKGAFYASLFSAEVANYRATLAQPPLQYPEMPWVV